MKYLYLIRHGKSEGEVGPEGDFARLLNEQGEHDVPLVANRVKELPNSVESLFTSPARRARRTADLIAEIAEIPNIVEIDELYNYPGAIISVIREFEDGIPSAGVVMHNPSATDTANELGDQTIENLPTSGLCVIRFDVDRWAEITRGITELVEYPKLWITK